jgi:acyl-CoA reductase-like NAD-dependent aldehyde dehydrogenase
MTTTLAPHSPLADLVPAARAFLARTPALFIGGRWVPAASGETFATHNPADGSVLAQIAAGDSDDVDRAATAIQRLELSELFGMRVDQVCQSPQQFAAFRRRHATPRTALERGAR